MKNKEKIKKLREFNNFFIVLCIVILVIGIFLVFYFYDEIYNTEPIYFYEGNLSDLYINQNINFTGLINFTGAITNEYGILFNEGFNLIGETDREKRIYLFGFLYGLYDSFGISTSDNITLVVNNVTKVYTIDNFPLEDDCLDKNKTRCFVKWEIK